MEGNGSLSYILRCHVFEGVADWIENIFWNPSISYTTAATIFVTAKTTVKVFIPMVMVYMYYLCVTA
jgi:hypothetical protein